MFRFIVVILAMAGAGFLLSAYLPASHAIAFTYEGVNISYLLICVVFCGFIAVKVTK